MEKGSFNFDQEKNRISQFFFFHESPDFPLSGAGRSVWGAEYHSNKSRKHLEYSQRYDDIHLHQYLYLCRAINKPRLYLKF